jgi:hypothetical protein
MSKKNMELLGKNQRMGQKSTMQGQHGNHNWGTRTSTQWLLEKQQQSLLKQKQTNKQIIVLRKETQKQSASLGENMPCWVTRVLWLVALIYCAIKSIVLWIILLSKWLFIKHMLFVKIYIRCWGHNTYVTL